MEDTSGRNEVAGLADLAAKKLIESLAESQQPMAEFDALEDRQKALVFSTLLNDRRRLQMVEEAHKELLHNIPSADAAVWSGHDRLRDDAHVDDADCTCEARKKKFQRLWKHRTVQPEWNEDIVNHERRNDTAEMGWNCAWGALYLEAEKFRVCKCQCDPNTLIGKRLMAMPCVSLCDTHIQSHVALCQRISSQLLLYRLAVVFGLPPSDPQTDGYKLGWNVKLVWTGEGDSCMNFYDFKGGASGVFRGSKEASDAALELMSWLVSDQVPHSYDGVLAGRIA